MSAAKTRNRLVNFRLTEEEYNRLQAAVSETGARNFSDFARDAVLRVAGVSSGRPAGQPAAPPPADLDGQVSELKSSIVKLSELLERIASANGNSK